MTLFKLQTKITIVTFRSESELIIRLSVGKVSTAIASSLSLTDRTTLLKYYMLYTDGKRANLSFFGPLPSWMNSFKIVKASSIRSQINPRAVKPEWSATIPRIRSPSVGVLWLPIFNPRRWGVYGSSEPLIQVGMHAAIDAIVHRHLSSSSDNPPAVRRGCLVQIQWPPIHNPPRGCGHSNYVRADVTLIAYTKSWGA